MNSKQPLRGLLSRAPLATAVAAALLAAAPAAQAFEFSKGDFTGSIDTTVSYGISVRTEAPSPGLIGKSQYNPLLCAQNVPLGAIPPGAARCTSTGGVPGSAAQINAPGRFSINRDDGNMKYGEGEAFSNAFKITSEASLKWNDWGSFVRATYFYDFDNTDRDDLTEAAQEKVGKDFRLLDAFVYKDFKVGEDHSGTIRLGRQVVSWGESTFIQNGINVINPVDVSKLRVAGSELKEAFQPLDMIWGSFSFTENLSVEALYMFEFEEIEIDPSGTYFSANDFASPGGTYVMLGFGVAPQPVNNPELFNATCFGGAGNVVNSDRYAALSAQYGAATAAQIITIGCGSSFPRIENRNADDNGQYGVALRWYSEALGNTDFGFYFLNYHSRLPLLSGRAVTGTSANTGRFFVEYPEDIQMFGLSWNTSLPGGVAWQGEISHRPNMPLQVDDVELLFAGLTPLNAFIAPQALQFSSQLGNYTFGQEVRGWREHEVTQVQMTFTKAFSEVLGANQLALVGEIGATEVWDLPEQSVLRYEGEGTDTGGGASVANYTYTTIPGIGQVPLAALTAQQGPKGRPRQPADADRRLPDAVLVGLSLRGARRLRQRVRHADHAVATHRVQP